MKDVSAVLRNVVPRQGTETVKSEFVFIRTLLRNVVPRQGTETCAQVTACGVRTRTN